MIDQLVKGNVVGVITLCQYMQNLSSEVYTKGKTSVCGPRLVALFFS